jgi:hypothetical protein
MTIVKVSAWRQTFQAAGMWLDHTYVGQGPGTATTPPPDYFACWAPHFDVTQYPAAPVVSGSINYNCANCYRRSLFGFPDTAGIGIYGVNGVCHQSTNCFLYSAGPWMVTLNPRVVLGYWASLTAYGIYGTGYLLWLAGTYGVCSWFNPAVVAAMPEAAPEPAVTGKLRDLYASFQVQPEPPDLHEMIIRESATVVQDAVPGLDPSAYKDLHAEFLSQKDAAIATGETGRVLADKLNGISKEFQLAVSGRVGTELYTQLTGMERDQTTYLCDPRLADATGVPVTSFSRE